MMEDGKTDLASGDVSSCDSAAALSNDEFGISLLSEWYLAGTTEQSDSKSFRFPDWTVGSSTGVPLLELSSTELTIVRAPLTEGGYRCFYNFRSIAIGRYNTLGKAISFRIDAKNSQSGLLQRFTFQTPIRCGRQEILISASFDPDIFDIWKSVSYGIFPYDKWQSC
jgi:hypothetical protein